MISNAYIFWTTKANQNLIRFSKSWKIILLNDFMVFFCYLHSLTPKIEVKVGRYFKKSNFLTVTLRDRAAVAWKIPLWYFRGCYPLVRQTFQKRFLTYGPLQVGQVFIYILNVFGPWFGHYCSKTGHLSKKWPKNGSFFEDFPKIEGVVVMIITLNFNTM